MQLDNLHIRVDRAGQSAHGSAGGNVVYERNRTVFVGNLPFDVEVVQHSHAHSCPLHSVFVPAPGLPDLEPTHAFNCHVRKRPS